KERPAGPSFFIEQCAILRCPHHIAMSAFIKADQRFVDVAAAVTDPHPTYRFTRRFVAQSVGRLFPQLRLPIALQTLRALLTRRPSLPNVVLLISNPQQFHWRATRILRELGCARPTQGQRRVEQKADFLLFAPAYKPQSRNLLTFTFGPSDLRGVFRQQVS